MSGEARALMQRRARIRLFGGAIAWPLAARGEQRFVEGPNLKTAKVLRVAFPRSLLVRADEVIQ